MTHPYVPLTRMLHVNDKDSGNKLEFLINMFT